MNVGPTEQASRGRILSWAFFDFANTAFYVLILTVGYPLYFREVVVQGGRSADLLWGTAFSASMLIVAMISPILGAVADHGAGKKWFLGLFTALCVLSTAALSTVEAGMILAGMFFLILANIGFEAGLVFYDSFLPEITSERSYGRVSGYGFALGYLGSLVTLGVAFPLYADGFAAANLPNVRMSFLIGAGFFAVFALPLFLFLPDRQRTTRLQKDFLKVGFRRLRETFRSFDQYRNTAKFLLAYFIYIDAVNTIIVFSSIFALETLKFGVSDIVIFFAVVQTSALVGSIGFGVLADHIGHKKTLTISLLLWLILVVLAYFVQDRTTFTLLGILAGIALGSSQSTSRSLMSEITPHDKKTEFFGFYSFFGKASAIIGPFLFGLMSSSFNQRIAILSVGAFLLVGVILLQRVQESTVFQHDNPM